MKRMGKVMKSKKTWGTRFKASRKQILFRTPLFTLYEVFVWFPQKDRLMSPCKICRT